MPVSTVLVDGAGIVGRVAAIALARLGLDVTLVERQADPSATDALGLPGEVLSALRARGILPPEEPEGAGAADIDGALAERARALGVETRSDCVLVGSVKVDRHVEAELSDGRVENYDVIVMTEHGASGETTAGPPSSAAPGPGWQMIAGGDLDHLDEVAALSLALGALSTSS